MRATSGDDDYFASFKSKSAPELLSMLRKDKLTGERSTMLQRAAEYLAPATEVKAFQVNWVGDIDSHQRKLFWGLIEGLCEKLTVPFMIMMCLHNTIVTTQQLGSAVASYVHDGLHAGLAFARRATNLSTSYVASAGGELSRTLSRSAAAGPFPLGARARQWASSQMGMAPAGGESHRPQAAAAPRARAVATAVASGVAGHVVAVQPAAVAASAMVLDRMVPLAAAFRGAAQLVLSQALQLSKSASAGALRVGQTALPVLAASARCVQQLARWPAPARPPARPVRAAVVPAAPPDPTPTLPTLRRRRRRSTATRTRFGDLDIRPASHRARPATRGEASPRGTGGTGSLWWWHGPVAEAGGARGERRRADSTVPGPRDGGERRGVVLSLWELVVSTDVILF